MIFKNRDLNPLRFVIIGQPRTGSTYLTLLLNSHPDVLCENELFNPYEIVKSDPRYSIKDIDKIVHRDSQPLEFLDEFFTQKGYQRYKALGFNYMLGHTIKVFDELFDNEKYKLIYIHRKNKLAQYSSFKIALDNGIWGAKKAHRAKKQMKKNSYSLSFCPGDFNYESNGLAISDHIFQRLLGTRTPGSYMILEYKELFNKETQHLICDFLNVMYKPLKTSLVKQNSNMIIDRFKNPESVREYMERIGKSDWLFEEL